MVDLFRKKYFTCFSYFEQFSKSFRWLLHDFFLVSRAGEKSFINNRNHRKKLGLSQKQNRKLTRKGRKTWNSFSRRKIVITLCHGAGGIKNEFLAYFMANIYFIVALIKVKKFWDSTWGQLWWSFNNWWRPKNRLGSRTSAAAELLNFQRHPVISTRTFHIPVLGVIITLSYPLLCPVFSVSICFHDLHIFSPLIQV